MKFKVPKNKVWLYSQINFKGTILEIGGPKDKLPFVAKSLSLGQLVKSVTAFENENRNGKKEKVIKSTADFRSAMKSVEIEVAREKEVGRMDEEDNRKPDEKDK